MTTNTLQQTLRKLGVTRTELRTLARKLAPRPARKFDLPPRNTVLRVHTRDHGLALVEFTDLHIGPRGGVKLSGRVLYADVHPDLTWRIEVSGPQGERFKAGTPVGAWVPELNRVEVIELVK